MIVCFAVTVQPDSKYLQGNLHDISHELNNQCHLKGYGSFLDV